MLKTKLYKLAPTKNDFIRLFRFLGCRTISNFATVSSFYEQIEKKKKSMQCKKMIYFPFEKTISTFPHLITKQSSNEEEKSIQKCLH